jgi:hypothetical protein
MSGPRIIGSALVRDEDLYLERALRNVIGFCDGLILVDHRSRDRTPEILERVAADSPIPTSLHRVRDASMSHELIKRYAGEDVWAFGIDGDEIYDPAGMARFREMLLAGELADRWSIRGNCLHCTSLDLDAEVARGYMAPPAPSVTTLFNFRLIDRWDGWHPERLNGVEGLRFKPGARQEKHHLGVSWDESPFRCLHLCFLRRSSRDSRPGPRMNVPDRNKPRRAPVRLWRAAREAAGLPPASEFKDHYRQGGLVQVSTRPFFPR